ncbi:MAG: YlbF family regulator [Spirochaetes bacterium]|nr:YlbF family regulator [Spirochaetota bacterium]
MSSDNEKEKLVESAVELFGLIEDSSIFRKYAEYSAKVKNDMDAQRLLAELVEMGKVIEESLEKGDDAFRKKAEYDLLNKKFESNDIVKNYLKSQKEYLGLMNSVRSVISDKLKIC